MRPAPLAVRLAVTLLAVVVAAWFGWKLWVYYEEDPWTRDARTSADIIGVTPDVSGLVSSVQVADNQAVHRGDLLLVVDPARFDLALRQAEAAVAIRLEQAQATEEGAAGAYQQAIADRDLAKLNLDRTRIVAPTNGIITNFDLQPGDYVTAGHPITALVDTDSLRIDAYFEETRLPRIHPGDRVNIRLMGEARPLTGHITSIAGGIEDRERQPGANLLANINPTFSWVRLAQRIPVRIALDHVPEGVQIIPGRTATVSVVEAK